MKHLLKDLHEYLRQTLHASFDVRLWTKREELPFFLIDSYDFYEISLFRNPCLLMIAKQSTAITPLVIRKHWEQIQKVYNGFVIYVQPLISSYNRKRLVEQHVPFIVPGNQMYLPPFGIDLREYFRKLHSKEHKFLSPATQTVVIYALMHETSEDLSPSLLAKKLGYTPMTMGRAFEELKGMGIGEFPHKGRERIWLFPCKKELWEQAKSFLRSPVKRRIWLKRGHPNVISGLSALSHLSMISPPIIPVFAIGLDLWDKWKKRDMETLPTAESAKFELEIWYYNPELFAKNGVVDPFSLYLSMRTSNDERVLAALEEMKEKSSW